MRKHFREKMDLLSKELVEMGMMIETAIDSAVLALYKNDDEKARIAIALEVDIDNKEREIENLCLKLIMTEQPVASDLRMISAALKMITDMERIGDQAEDIAEIALSIKGDSLEKFEKLLEMSSITADMVKKSIDSFVKADVELARLVIESDDKVDSLFLELRDELISFIQNKPQKSAMAVDLIMVIKYLERIADHATNIAGWVEYAVTGVHKDYQPQIEN